MLGKLLGGTAGGLVKPLAENIAKVADSKERTKQTFAVAEAYTKIASAAWRPALARATGGALVLYVIGTVILVLTNLYGVVYDVGWVQVFEDGTTPLSELWKHWTALGVKLFSFAGLFLTTYAGSRGIEKVAGAIGGKTGGIIGGAARLINGGKTSKPVLHDTPDAPLKYETEANPNVVEKSAIRPVIHQSDNAIDMVVLEREIKEEEGFRDYIYFDSLGHATFGYGSLVHVGDPEYGQPVNTPISIERIDEAFRQDLQNAIRDARTVVRSFDHLPQDIKHALVSMAFQLGGAGLAKFKNMLKAIELRDGEAARRHALDSRWAQQTPARANRMANRLAALSAESGHVQLA